MSKKRISLLISLLICALGGILWAGFLVPAQASGENIVTQPTVLRKGHLDVFYIWGNSTGLQLGIKEDITGQGVVRTAESALLKMGADWYTTDVADFNLPGGEKSGYLTPGIAADMMTPGWAANDYTQAGIESVKLQFTEVSGLGSIAIFRQTLQGTIEPFLAAGKFYIENGSELEISARSHTHATWVFSQAGTYKMQVRAVGITENGQEISSPPATYTWVAEKTPAAGNTEGTDNAGENPSPNLPETTPDNPDNPSNPLPTPEIDPSNPQAAKTILERGHLDVFNIEAPGGKLQLNLKEDITDASGTSTIRRPEDTELRVGETAHWQPLQYLQTQLGKESGYLLPEFFPSSAAPNLLWPGWDSGAARNFFQSVDINFLEITSPGKVYLFGTGFGKAQPLLQSGTLELRAGEKISQKMLGHAHANWYFTKPGTYKMRVQASGVPLDKNTQLAVDSTSTALASDLPAASTSAQPDSMVASHTASHAASLSNIATYTWVVGETSAETGPSGTGSPANTDQHHGIDSSTLFTPGKDLAQKDGSSSLPTATAAPADALTNAAPSAAQIAGFLPQSGGTFVGLLGALLLILSCGITLNTWKSRRFLIKK